MVRDAIEREGVANPRVLWSMRNVPRHEFVRRADRRRAYHDGALPIGHGQTISPPFIVAYMTEIIDPLPEDRVLEIGTGSGYQAAVLSGLVKDVYTIEIVEPLGRQAALTLRRLKYDNIHTRIGDGYQGWPEEAPFDKIIVTCSPEDVPQPLVDQLRDGGKMIVPLGERYQQVFHLFEKRDGKFVRERLIPTLFVPMTGTAEAERSVLPDPTTPEVVNGSFELDENDDGRVDNWHYQRQVTHLMGDAPDGTAHIRIENAEPGRPAQLLQGFSIDGSRVGTLDVEVLVNLSRLGRGATLTERPALMIHFYDETRRNIENAVLDKWSDSNGWERKVAVVPVPAQAREAVLRVGLNGATGQLDVDAIQIEGSPR